MLGSSFLAGRCRPRLGLSVSDERFLPRRRHYGQLEWNSTEAAGDPVALVSAIALNFGDVSIGTASTMAQTLSSTRTSSVAVDSATVPATPCCSWREFPGYPQAFSCRYRAVRTFGGGYSKGVLQLASNSTRGIMTTVALTGDGTSVAHFVMLPWDARELSPDPASGCNVWRSKGTAVS